MKKTLPIDQGVRDGAIHDLDTSIFLQAGAGTGKTSVLIGRLVEVIRRGRAELREIVAITFTEKAAGELRNRVRHQLRIALQGANSDEAKHIRIAISQVDAAHIETIHAFASGLLRERPIEAGLDPNFAVLDAMSQQLNFDQSWNDWLWLEEEHNARPRIERCLRLGLTTNQLTDLVQSIAEFRDVDPRQQADDVPSASETLSIAIRQSSILIGFADQLSNREESLIENLHKTLTEMESLSLQAIESELVTFQFPLIKQNRSTSEFRLTFDKDYESLKKIISDYATKVRTQALVEFIETAYEFILRAAQQRRQNGTLTFQDLLIEARNLLQSEPTVRHYFRDRFKFLFIDEFQDTDPLQAQIIMLLTARNDPLTWRETEMIPGHLFIVGDPKQSIYRFRRADIDIYAEVEAVFQKAAKQDSKNARVAVLEVNFRSRPKLVEWHNHIFSRLITRDIAFPNAQPDYQRLSAFRNDNDPAVINLLPNMDASWKRIGDARRDEAATLAQLINTIVKTTEPFIDLANETHPGTTRKPRYRDICILVRTRTNLEIYTEAFDKAGVPYHLDSGRGFFVQQEIRDAAAILTALDDPSDEVAVVSALKTASFAASDEELLDYRRAGGRFRLTAEALPDTYQGSLRDSLEILYELLSYRGSLPLPAYIDQVLRRTHLMEVQFARGSAQRAGNLQTLIQRAASFASNNSGSLRPFVRWLNTQTRTDLAEAESPIIEVDDDVVRILTIHQAKGLEFPIVILAKMAAATASSRSIAVVNRDTAKIDFQIGNRYRRFSTPGYESARTRQQAYERSEERRLFYVASTRARDCLVLPIFLTDRARGYHADLEEALPGWTTFEATTTLNGSITLRAEDLDVWKPEQKPSELPDTQGLWKTWQVKHTEALKKGRPKKIIISPSNIAHDEVKASREIEPTERSGTTTIENITAENGINLQVNHGSDSIRFVGIPSGDIAKIRGTAIHDALFIADFNNWQMSEFRARRLCAERGLQTITEEIIADLRTTFSSKLIERIRKAQQVERELPLVTFTPQKIVEGYVDIAFREGHEWTIVDYKSDRSVEQETLSRYEQQVREYARMFKETGEILAETFLFFTANGSLHSVSL